MKHLFLAVLVCITSTGTLSAQNNNRNSMDSSMKASDKKFATEAAEAGLAEVEMGKLGQNQGSSAKVKEYGRMMEKDHRKANDELQELAKKDNITLPSTLPSAMQNKHDALKKKSGQDFDRAFMKQMIEDHKKVITLFENEEKNGQNEQLRTWARKTLPTLRQHLEHAQKIYDDLDK